MQTIVELPEFQRKAMALLNDSEKQGIISYLASHPQSGAIMQGTRRYSEASVKAKEQIFPKLSGMNLPSL